MPSLKVLEQNKQLVTELVEKLKNSSAGVIIDYRGLTVEQDTKLRTEFRKSDVDYKVVKNTLLTFAAKDAGLEELIEYLNGPTSLAVSLTDPVAAAKVISQFTEKNDKISVKAGFIEGKVVNADAIKQIAKLPSKEVLLSQLLCGLNGPVTGLACVLKANITGLALALSQVAEKKSA